MAQRFDLPVEFQFKVEPVVYMRGAIRLRKWSWVTYDGWKLQATISSPAELAGLGGSDDLYNIRSSKLPPEVREQLSEPGQRLSSAVKEVELDVLLCTFPQGCDLNHPAKPRVIDPWQLRHDFLHLKPSSEAFLDFLNYYGQWSRITYPRYISWAFYDPRIREGNADDCVPGLVFESEIRSEQATIRDALKAKPGDWLARSSLGFSSQSKFPHYVHTDGTCLDAIRTSISIDFLRRVPFRICKRADCGEPFAADRKGKEYCSQYCAHLASVRRARKELRKQAARARKADTASALQMR
jgi:hypothetical protein